MSNRNPTQIRLGMTANFFNRNYRVIGRAVLGVMESGRAYYWNEFYLESGGGPATTLVFEETETGCAWRLFTMFDQRPPMTVTEAAAKKEGDVVTLDGAHLRVTRVDQSQVYYVEGKTPEGIAKDKVAHYFNAEAGSRQIVVSWTGEEVEYYSGTTTAPLMVASAFRLQGFAARRFMASKGRSWRSAQIWMPALLILALIGVPVGCFIDLAHSRPMPAIKVTQAPVSPLHVGDSFNINKVLYKTTGHYVVEMAEVGRRWQRHEYSLSGLDNREAWLVCEPESNHPSWLLYTRLQPDNPLTPFEAGAMRTGQKVKIDGSDVSIVEIFRSTIHSSEGESISGGKAGDVLFGFTGLMSSNRFLLVRWNQTNITYQEGTRVLGESFLGSLVKVPATQAPR